MALVLAATLAFAPVALATRTFWIEYASFRGKPTPVDHDEARRVLPQLLEVSWAGPSGVLRGWFLPGRETAAVVLVHGAGGNRGDLLSELGILSRAGFSLLAFDLPGQGESGGQVAWDEPERAAVRSGLDWLSARPEVDPGRIGAFGFSSGGYPLLQVAVTDERIRAVAVAGTPGNMTDFARYEYRRRGSIGQWAALLAMRLRGMHVEEQVPVETIHGLAPRPLLVIVGESDTVVPPGMTVALFRAASEPKELLALPNVGHGEYAKVAPGVYSERLISFFTRALLKEPATGPAR